MGRILVTDPDTGVQYPVIIGGDQPTEEEYARISQYLQTVPKYGMSQVQQGQPESKGGLGMFAGQAASGFVQGLADIPMGIAALGEAAYDKVGLGDQSTFMDNSAAKWATGLSKGAAKMNEAVFGRADDSTAAKAGQALGSLASFFVPGIGAGKLAGLAGVGLKGARTAGLATSTAQGMALGSADQLARMAQRIEQGEIIPEDTQRLAVLFGGAIGSTETLPIAEALGTAIKILRRVPPSARNELAKDFGKALKDIITTGAAEGAQEAISGIAQSAVEKGLYNPNADYFQSLKDDAVFGGGAGLAMQAIIEGARGVHMRPVRQLQRDMQAEAEKTKEQAKFGISALADEGVVPQAAVDKINDGVPIPEAVATATQEQQAAAKQANAAKQEELSKQNVQAHAEAARQQEAEAKIQKAREYFGREPASPEEVLIGSDPELRKERGLPVTPKEYRRRIAAEKRRAYRQERKRFTTGQATAEEIAVDDNTKSDYRGVVPVKLTAPRANAIREHLPEFSPFLNNPVGAASMNVVSPEGLAAKIEQKFSKQSPDAAPVSPALRSSMLSLAKRLRAQKSARRVAGKPRVAGPSIPTDGVMEQAAQREQQKPDVAIPIPEKVDQQADTQAEPANQDVAPQEAQQEPQQVKTEPNYTPEFAANVEKAIGFLREELGRLGLKGRVGLIAQKVLEPNKLKAGQAVTEGLEVSAEDGRRVIALATHLYDANLSDTELRAKLKSVFDHELVHSLRNLGVITEAEWSTLSKAVAKRQYVANEGGRSVARDYTYLDREIAKNAQLPSEMQVKDADALVEEAVAEMFRHYNDGRLRVGGPVGGIFKKIINFFKGLIKTTGGRGFDQAYKIFDDINSGEIGGRASETQGSATDEVRRSTAALALREGADGKAWRIAGKSRGTSGHGVKRVYRLDPAVAEILREEGISAPTMLELDGSAGAGRFRRAISKAKKSSGKYGAAVHVYPLSEYKQMRKFISRDGSAGFALKDVGDGLVDIVSVFNTKGGKHKGASLSMLSLATHEGGNILDGFDTVLPFMAGRNGFRVVSRLKFDPEFAPNGWDEAAFSEFNNGQPDVVFMAHDPSRTDGYQPGEGEYKNSYDDALAAQRDFALNAPNRSAKPMDYRMIDQDFVSPLGEALKGAKQTVASANDWRNIIKKLPGVKKYELDFTGFDRWLEAKGKDKLTKDDLLSHLEDVRIRLAESVGSKGYSDYYDGYDLPPISTSDIETRLEWVEGSNIATEIVDKRTGKVFGTVYQSAGGFSVIVDGDELFFDSPADAVNALIEDYNGKLYGTGSDQAHFEASFGGSTYNLPGGTNYREILMRIPELEAKGPNDPTVQRPYVKQGHFEQENVVVHARVKDRMDSADRKVLFIEEVQSDLASKWRKVGVGRDRDARTELSKLSKEVDDLRVKHIDADEKLYKVARERERLNFMYDGAPQIAVSSSETLFPMSQVPDAIRDIVDQYEIEDGPDSGTYVAGGEEVTTRNVGAVVARTFLTKNGMYVTDKTGTQIFATPSAAVDGAVNALKREANGKKDRIWQQLKLAHFKYGKANAEYEEIDRKLQASINKLARLEKAKRIPDTPFRGEDANNLMIKKLIKDAATQGYDRVAWTTGATQATRWGGAAVEAVIDGSWASRTDEHVIVDVMLDTGGRGSLLSMVVDRSNGHIMDTLNGPSNAIGNNVSELFGPELAEKIKTEDSGEFIGEDVKLPKTGYQIVYDQQLPKLVKKLTSKHGVKPYRTKDIEHVNDAWVIDINDKLREAMKGPVAYSAKGITVDFQERKLQSDLQRFQKGILEGVSLGVAERREAQVTAEEQGAYEGVNVGDRFITEKGNSLEVIGKGAQVASERQIEREKAFAKDRGWPEPSVIERNGKSYLPTFFVRSNDGSTGAHMANGVRGSVANGTYKKATGPVPVEDVTVGNKTFTRSTIKPRFSAKPIGDDFKTWAGTDTIIGPREINSHQFETGKPVVMLLYHGTTHQITEFRSGERGNVDNYFGAVNYFTNSQKDAADNYLAEGPDISRRIADRADEIAMRWLEEGKVNDIFAEHAKLEAEGKTDTDKVQYLTMKATEAAKEELTGDTPQVMELYVRSDNPFVINGPVDTEIGLPDMGDVMADAVAFVAIESGVSVEEVLNDKSYDPAIDETAVEILSIKAEKFINAVEEVASDYGVNTSVLFSSVFEDMYGMTASEFEKRTRDAGQVLAMMGDESGYMVGQVFADVVKKLGYDSIIMQNADKKLGNAPPETTHVHVDDQFNDNIKLAENETFTKGDPDIRRSAAPIARESRLYKDENRVIHTIAMNRLGRLLGKVMKKDVAERRAEWFVTQFQDRMAPIGKIIDELRSKGYEVSDALDVYRKEMIYHGKTGAYLEEAEEELYNPAVFAVDRVNVSPTHVSALKKASGFFKAASEDYDSQSLAVVEAYLYARHARERNAYIKSIDPTRPDNGSGMTNAEAEAILAWFMKLPASQQMQIKSVENKVRKIIQDTNARRQEAGLISSDEIAKGLKNYIALRGKLLDEDIGAFDSANNTGRPRPRPLFGGFGREDRRLIGRDGQYARDLLANVMAQNSTAIVRSERNKVGLSLLNLIRKFGKDVEGIARIWGDNPGKPIYPMTKRRTGSGTVARYPENFREKPDQYVVVKDKGREIVIEVNDPRIAQAMNGTLSPSGANRLVQLHGKLNRFLASVNTSWNPEFLLSNAPRDFFTALYNIGQYDNLDGIKKEVAKDYIPALKGVAQYLRNRNHEGEWAGLYREFIDAGGRNALNMMEDLEARAGSMNKVLRKLSDATSKNNLAAIKNGLLTGRDSVLGLLEDMNTVFENATRVAFYKALRDRGVSKDKAAAAARELTTNFAKGGELKNVLNSLYLFYNASVQGSFAIINATLRNPKVMMKRLAAVAALGALMDMLNSMFSDEDDDGQLVYDKLNDYSLEHNIILPDIFGISDRSFGRIPIPYGLNMIYNAGRVASRIARGKYEASQAFNSLFGTVMETLNPFGDTYNPFTGDGSLAAMVSPTAFDPFIQVMQNENFAGRPIYKEQQQFGVGLPASETYWSSTNPSFVAVSKLLNHMSGGNEIRPGVFDFSPDLMEFWLEFVAGAAGQTAVRALSLPWVGFDAVSNGIQDDMINNIPGLRKFVTSVSSREDIGAFVRGRDKVLLARKELKMALTSGDAEWAAKVRKKYADELRIAPKIAAINNIRRKLKRRRAQIEGNDRLSEQQKEAMIERIDSRLKEIIATANKILSVV